MARETAKIYEFPAGGRAARVGRLAGNFGQTNLEREVAALPFSVYDESWYHNAAIADDDQAGKH